jgi:hypothetical protein
MESVQVSARRACTVWLAMASLVVAGGCALDPKKQSKFHLEGSLSQVMDLGYDEARILIAPDDVSLLFVRIKPLEAEGAQDAGAEAIGTSEDYPLKLAYRLLNDGLPSGGRVDLAVVDADGVQRGVASRNVQSDPRTTLPALVRGTLSFNRPLDPGTTVSGDFHVTFENGTEAASGRTAFSTYLAKVQP